MIAVTGATGAIGGELVRRLSRSGAQVRALTGQPEDRPALAGVEWRRTDLEAPEDLAAVLEGAQKLFLLSANSDGMVRREKNALAAAVDAGVLYASLVAFAIGALLIRSAWFVSEGDIQSDVRRARPWSHLIRRRQNAVGSEGS